MMDDPMHPAEEPEHLRQQLGVVPKHGRDGHAGRLP